ncbi:MAG: hypothetical protein IPQ12_11040 [Polaromonas sp.]|nr:hypothetical protein [Polaromonas sp.]
MGGRLDRWVDALSLIPSHPFGWSSFDFGYAHNLWLDVARNGGWFSFLMSILLSVLFVFNFKSALKNNREDILYLSFIWCLAIGFSALFMVEPIMDGFVYVFSAFCLFWGVINANYKFN